MNATRNFLRSKDMAGAVDALTVSRMIWVVFAKDNDGTGYGSRTMDEILCKLEVEAVEAGGSQNRTIELLPRLASALSLVAAWRL
jgi:hypothetical protein